VAGAALDGTVLGLYPPLTPGTLVQSGGSVSWPTAPANYEFLATGQYTSDVYTLVATCHNSTLAPTLISGTTSFLTANDTLTFYLGFAARGPWVQTVEGDVYSRSTLSTAVPVSYLPYTFTKPGTGGSQGIVTVGGGIMGVAPYPSWSVYAQPYGVQNLYATYYPRLKAGGTHALASQSITALAKSGTEQSTVYTATGPVTVDAAITIPAGDKVIVLIDGSLTINNTIKLGSSDSFVAFIVNGDITLAPSVSGTGGLDPGINGVYMAGNGGTATFHTGAGASQLFAKGMFIADSFDLARNMGAANPTQPAELFIFDPALMFSMPDVLKDLPYTWQEVAP
jgi:hypothetical protein